MDEDYDIPLVTHDHGWKAKKLSQINLDKFSQRRGGGAYFIPSLDHCDGCIAPSSIGDKCELMPGRTDKTEYDAIRCGDEAAIKDARDRQGMDGRADH